MNTLGRYKMDPRLTFNMDDSCYDRFRPMHTDDLFDDVIRFSSLDKDKRALEIGIGTGLATMPFLKTGCNITAIEIGDKLAQFSRDKFAEYINVEVVNQDFESVSLDENSYELIYSASAFHWIPQETGLPKVYVLLKNGGVFAWFISREIQKVYNKHTIFFREKTPLSNYQFWQQQARKNVWTGLRH